MPKTRSGASPGVDDTLLTVSNLDVTFATHQGGRRSVLSQVDLDLAVGEAVGIVGESGSGKSILTRCILGLQPQNAAATGSIRFGDVELLGLPDRAFRKIRGNAIGYIPQDPLAAFNPTLTVGAQILEALEFHDESRRRPRLAEATEMLRSVLISDPARRSRQHPHQMSGGMLQRALIASAVSMRPSLLIADEPTTGLDVTTQAGIVKLLREIRSESTMAMLFVSHDLALVGELCDRIVVLYRGDVVETGTAREIIESPRHPYTQALIAATPELRADA